MNKTPSFRDFLKNIFFIDFGSFLYNILKLRKSSINGHKIVKNLTFLIIELIKDFNIFFLKQPNSNFVQMIQFWS